MANSYWDRLKQFVTGVKTTAATTSTTLNTKNKELTKKIYGLAQNECKQVWNETILEASEPFDIFEEDFAPIASLTGEF